MKAVKMLKRLVRRKSEKPTRGTDGTVAFRELPERPPEVDFRSASYDEILDQYFRNGCVVLRRFADHARLDRLINMVNEYYDKWGGLHIHPCDLRDRGLPQFYEVLFEARHEELLSRVFGKHYHMSEETGSRRIDPASKQGQPPLGPHMDACFHRLAFTVNFWVPFLDCGGDVPSLGTVRASFEEMAQYSGYDGGKEVSEGWNTGWLNFARFSPPMLTLARAAVPGAALLRGSFGDRVWTPTFSVGDAMMLSNWTLHFTHAVEGTDRRRGNVELRFLSDLSMPQVVAAFTVGQADGRPSIASAQTH
jgi:hypothetical protein